MRRYAAVTVLAMLAIAPAWATDAWRLPDPTRPGASAARIAPTGARQLVLQSTLVSPRRQTAVINGRTLHVGDTIAGKEVREIRASEVILSDGRRVTSLRLTVNVERTSKAGGETSAGSTALGRADAARVSQATANR